MTQSRTWLSRLTYTRAPGAVMWICFYIGAVFLGEGILKFLHTDTLRTGRFEGWHPRLTCSPPSTGFSRPAAVS